MEKQTSGYQILLDSIKELDFRGGPDLYELLLVGNKPFPLVVNREGQVLAAAAFHGLGKIVVLSHESYFKSAGWTQFQQNVLHWFSTENKRAIGVHPTFKSSNQSLDPENSPEIIVSPKVLAGKMNIYCLPAYHAAHQIDDLVKFVKNGGNLLIGGQAKAWANQNASKDVLIDFPANQVISSAGIYFTANQAEKGLFRISRGIPYCNLTTTNVVDFKSDLEVLLDGIPHYELDYCCIPSSLLVHGSLAFTVVADENNYNTGVAAARYGNGRVVVMSHEAQLTHEKQKSFILNALKWLLDRKINTTIDTVVGLHPDADPESILLDYLSKKSIKAVHCCGIDGIKIFCCTAYESIDTQSIGDFVAEGGGLLIAGQAWSWSVTNPSKSILRDNPANRLINQFGISLLADCFDNKIYETTRIPQYHFRQVLDLVLKTGSFSAVQEPFRKKFAYDGSLLLKTKNCCIPQFEMMHETLCELLSKCKIRNPCQVSPLTDSRDIMELTLSCLAPASFARITIDGTNPAMDLVWRSTGLYAEPKTAVTITVPHHIIGQDWQIQIGCQTDDLLWVDQLKRPPLVVVSFPILQESITVSSKFGGMIYVIVPAGSKSGTVSVAVEDAVKAPYFKAGETSLLEWENQIRYYPAPWAEIETDDVVLTVPSESVRRLANPEPLTDIWDRIMKGVAKLAALPGERFLRPERIVADVQITEGWMHSGYPIMVHEECVGEMVDLDCIGKASIWGLIHELGHNQQRSAWEFPPHTTEATCNLWAVYIHEEVLRIPRAQAHESLRPESRKLRVKEYLSAGAKLDNWESFTCLETYLQLQEGFGWEPFIRVFSHYHKVSVDFEDNNMKMNYWAWIFSREVHRNLAPFFEKWGWIISEEVLEELNQLPQWEENPMLQYVNPNHK